MLRQEHKEGQEQQEGENDERVTCRSSPRNVPTSTATKRDGGTPAPRPIENSSNGSNNNSSSGLNRTSGVHSSRSEPRRMRKREKPPCGGKKLLKSSGLSPNKRVEGAGTRGGGSQHCTKSPSHPLDDSPYANGAISGYDSACRHRGSSHASPLPVLNITTGALEEREAVRTREEESNYCSRVNDGIRSTVVLDSPTSVNSDSSFETLASTGDLFDQYDGVITAASVAPENAEEDDKSGLAKTGLGIVDRTLFESWKDLPWQARLCPRAIEDQEVVRGTTALEAEVSDAYLSRLYALGGCVCFGSMLRSYSGYVTTGWECLIYTAAANWRGSSRAGKGCH